MKRLCVVMVGILMGSVLYGEYPTLSWVVISDLHYYTPELGTNGAAFEEYLANDRKLLRESRQLLQKWAEEMQSLSVDYVFITGDLTKDGERVNHEAVRQILYEVKRKSVRPLRIFVIPGNHDLNNPEALRYDGDKTEPVDFLPAEEFADFYKDFGYGEAWSRDTASLSYAVFLTSNLWLVALDTTINESNRMLKHPVTAGRLKPQTLQWLEGVARQAVLSNATIMLMMHHGLFEHWPGQRKLHPEYLLDNRKELAALMAKYRIRLVFTGHYHSQDISSSVVKGQILYDIETGSPLSYPSPYRICSLHGNVLTIQTRTLSLSNGFAEASRDFLIRGLTGQALEKIRSYGVPDKDGERIALDVAKAFAIHYAGDEPEKPFVPESRGMGIMARFILWYQGYVIRGLQTDLLPPDREIEIDLTTGEWRRL